MSQSRYKLAEDERQSRVRPQPKDKHSPSQTSLPNMASPENRYRARSPADSSNRGVHWPDERFDERGRRYERHASDASRSCAYSSPSREDSRPRRRSTYVENDEKPWFKKKTLWTTVASLATVAALVPSTMSANASIDAANAATRAARSTKRAARAGEQSARASYLSARAVNNTSMAQGHQDGFGRYTGPAHHAHGMKGVGHGSGRRVLA